MSIVIPEGYNDLLEKPIVIVISTVSPDGKPNTAAVWRKWDGEHILISTGATSRKALNIRANPNVAIMTIDPANPYRYLDLRGVATIQDDGALELLDELTMAYMGLPHYFGDVEPAEGQHKYKGVVLKIKPTRAVKFP
ncbi:MAG: PPOX class F420-dependent oxidoreductase [Anaerolineae bacterium]|nr:PPOX class F420-dependent oxidoreductase [Anaerolineae bacterium]